MSDTEGSGYGGETRGENRNADNQSLGGNQPGERNPGGNGAWGGETRGASRAEDNAAIDSANAYRTDAERERNIAEGSGTFTSERTGLGKAYDSMRDRLGNLSFAISPGLTVAGAVADKFGLFDRSVGTGSLAGLSSPSYGGWDGGDGSPSRSYGNGLTTQYAQSQQTGPLATATTAITDPNSATAWFKLNPGASDVAIRKAQDANKWSAEDVAKALGTDASHWSARYNAATPYFNFGSMMDDALAGDLSGYGAFMNQRVPPAKRSA